MQSTSEYKNLIVACADEHRGRLSELEQQFLSGKISLMEYGKLQGKEIVRYRNAAAKIRTDRDREVKSRKLEGRVPRG
jgi:hypothetical protein